jgi:hypothetical protein
LGRRAAKSAAVLLGRENLRIPGWTVFAGIVVVGALVLSPVIAQLEIPPLPGDMTFNWANHHIFLPFTQSLIASAAVALLLYWARK